MKWIYTKDHSDKFYDELAVICDDLGCSVADMLGAMNAESGVLASARNPHSSATGLIQWMADKTGHYYGFTRDEFAMLSAEWQLEYVKKYFWPYHGKLGSASAVYTAIFLPAFVAQASDPEYVLCARKGNPDERLGWAYASNAVFDANGDGRIQVKELELAIQRNWTGPRCSEMVQRAGLSASATWATPDTEDLTTTWGIQSALVRHGYNIGHSGPAHNGVDGAAGSRTRDAVLRFQLDHGLFSDGIVGPKTRAALAL